MEREGIVKLHGQALTLLGAVLECGEPAPDFALRDVELGIVTLQDTAGKVRIIASVPSIDTPTCAVETRSFNERAVHMSGDISVIVVSRDLPFAQKRFCAADGIERVRMLSDYADGSFGRAWGVYIKENDLLARAVFIVDREAVVRYIQIVPELADEPDYDSVLVALKDLMASGSA